MVRWGNRNPNLIDLKHNNNWGKIRMANRAPASLAAILRPAAHAQTPMTMTTAKFRSVRQLQAAIYQLPYRDAGQWRATSTVDKKPNQKNGGKDNKSEIVRTVQPLMADSRPLMGGWFGGWYWLSAQEITQWPRCREEIAKTMQSKGGKLSSAGDGKGGDQAAEATATTQTTGWVWTDHKRASIHRKLTALAQRGKGPLAKKAGGDDAQAAAGKKKKRR